MTTLQRELRIKLPEQDCSGHYDEQSGHLNILYEGAMLCSLHGDGLMREWSEKWFPKDSENEKLLPEIQNQLPGFLW